jgi:hypothetical protein
MRRLLDRILAGAQGTDCIRRKALMLVRRQERRRS